MIQIFPDRSLSGDLFLFVSGCSSTFSLSLRSGLFVGAILPPIDPDPIVVDRRLLQELAMKKNDTSYY